MTIAIEAEQQRVAEAVLALPMRLRKVYLMAHVQRLPRVEIALALDISPRRVEKRLGKALAVCRQRLQRCS